MLNPFKKKTELTELIKSFEFLVKDFGYELVKEETSDLYKGKNLLIYRNGQAHKQLEICAGNGFFHCIIRKIDNGKLHNYSDIESNIGFEAIALLENPGYDHFDYFAGGNIGTAGVIRNTVALFRRNKELLAGTDWFDLKKIESLKDENFKSTLGFTPRLPFVPFIEEIKTMMEKEFPVFLLSFYNRELPFYHENSTTDRLIYQFKDHEVTITQADWKDFPLDYEVYIDDRKMEEFKRNDFEKEEDLLKEIKNVCIKIKEAV